LKKLCNLKKTAGDALCSDSHWRHWEAQRQMMGHLRDDRARMLPSWAKCAKPLSRCCATYLGRKRFKPRLSHLVLGVLADKAALEKLYDPLPQFSS